VSAILVTVVISIILSPFSGVTATDNEPIFAGITLLQVEGALGWLFAVAAGALVARRSFVLPAVALTTAIWVFLAYVIYDIARVAEPASLVSIVVKQLPVLLLMALAACIGALVGQWFFRRHLKAYLESA